MKPFFSSVVMCLWTVASDVSFMPRPISSKLGAYPCLVSNETRESSTSFCRLVRAMDDLQVARRGTRCRPADVGGFTLGEKKANVKRKSFALCLDVSLTLGARHRHSAPQFFPRRPALGRAKPYAR